MTHDEPLVRDIAEFVLAAGELKRLQSYMERGRALGDLSDEALDEQFKTSHVDWSGDVADASLQTLTSDIAAEYALRQREVPYDLVKREIGIIAEAVSRLLKGLSPERVDELNEEIMSEYLAARRSKN